jgi:hypothetical protein
LPLHSKQLNFNLAAKNLKIKDFHTQNVGRCSNNEDKPILIRGAGSNVFLLVRWGRLSMLFLLRECY